MTTTTLPNVHCWGQRSHPLPADVEAVRELPHATRPEPIIVYRDRASAYGQLWTTAIREIPTPDGRSTETVREWCPLSQHDYRSSHFGATRSLRCHRATTESYHTPGCERGYHLCGHCGFPAWIEVHGCADGGCVYCGYHG